MEKAREVILQSCEMRLKGDPIHKRLAVLRYMTKLISNLPDYKIEKVIEVDTGKGELTEEILYSLSLASERYDNWMAKHNRAVNTKQEQAKAKQRMLSWADAGFPART